MTNPTEADAGRRSARSVRIKSANANLDVKQPGLYTLTDVGFSPPSRGVTYSQVMKVKDTHCSGRVIEEQATYLVNAISRPTAVFGQNTG